MRKPYVILVGSASGIGKSTISAELAKRLDIKHLLESDFIREIVRGIIGKEYAPALHKSSYDAYKVLRNKRNYSDKKDLINAGFVEHASFVIPAVEKVISRAIFDYDDVVIEGVHLVPGLINIEQFKDDAFIHFFVLRADEEDHKERFVKRAMQIHRGGKQLEYFAENRMIHNFLVDKAKENNVKFVNTQTIDGTVQNMLTSITETCKTVILNNTVDELADVVDIIINKHGGVIEEVSYLVPGFKEPLKRKVGASDPNKTGQFIESLKEKPSIKEDFKYLYNLSNNIRGNKICASDKKTLEAIISDLDAKGYLYKENEEDKKLNLIISNN
ncbi:2-phosphoglycerate kinase [Candidatus Methanobinarius endosymbioticus]|uniref:2-phosphoglycerate kinase n=1 Tax=Candidatus Methanobinarius endosymbioticus TaxID=2006182 RepID=A0A366MC04_9EURY|nr:2-phosphoglycerate kinase [Candidatus Methanobinarius endosymbioticus]